MNTNEPSALRRACELVGSPAALAAGLGVTKQAVHGWLVGERKVPIARCPQIERLTGGAVRCEQLRPDVEWAVLRREAVAA